MTNEELARQIVIDCGWFAQGAEVPFDDEDVECIAAAMGAVRREERERCAMIVETVMEHSPKYDRELIAAAIRNQKG